MIETAVAEQWLYERLTGDSTLMGLLGNDPSRVVGYLAPEGTPEPFVVFQHQASSDMMVVNGQRIWSNLVYVVKVVDRGESFSQAWDIAQRVDAVLHRASGTVSTGEVLECVRERLIAYVEHDGKEMYRHVGGVYRIYAR